MIQRYTTTQFTCIWNSSYWKVAYICDSTYVFSGKPEMIQSHKFMLISASPVFWSMFCGELNEKGDIVVSDVEPQAFKEMLR